MALRNTVKHSLSIHSTLFTTFALQTTVENTYRPTNHRNNIKKIVTFRIGKAACANVSPDRSLLTPDLKSRIPGEVIALVTRS
jgi:hypothetical protein